MPNSLQRVKVLPADFVDHTKDLQETFDNMHESMAEINETVKAFNEAVKDMENDGSEPILPFDQGLGAP